MDKVQFGDQLCNIVFVYFLEKTGNRIAIVLLTFTIVEFCIASATAYFWCRATRSDSNEVSA